MKKILGVVMVLILSPLAYLYAESSLSEVQAQWNDFQSTVASSEAQLAVGVHDSQLETLQGVNADVSENQSPAAETNENETEELVIDSTTNEGSDARINESQGSESVSGENETEEPITDLMTNEGSDNVVINADPSGGTTRNNLTDGGESGNTADQTNSDAKYSVDTILGGTGEGMVDGNVINAKISYAKEIVVDKNNNVYFIDAENVGTWSEKTVLREFKQDTKELTTYKYKQDMLNRGNFYTPIRITYNSERDSLFVLCKLSSSTQIFEMTDNMSSIANITDSILSQSNNKPYFELLDIPSLFSFIDSENIIIHPTRNDSVKVSLNGEVEVFENLFSSNVKAVISDGNGLFTMNHKLAYSQLFPRNAKEIPLSLEIEYIYDVVVHNKSFYALTSLGIYKIDTDGKASAFLDFRDLTFNDGDKGYFTTFTFDNNGNVIIFDASDASLRKINMN